MTFLWLEMSMATMYCFASGAGATPEPWNGERKLSFPGKLPTEAAVYGEALSEEELRAVCLSLHALGDACGGAGFGALQHILHS